MDVIQRQFTGRQHHVAVLAGVAITQQDVLPRECTCLVGNTPVLQQPDHGWHVY